jgi:hypothetical protein
MTQQTEGFFISHFDIISIFNWNFLLTLSGSRRNSEVSGPREPKT